MLNVVMLNVAFLFIVMLNVIMLSVVMLNVVAPLGLGSKTLTINTGYDDTQPNDTSAKLCKI